MKVLVFGPSGSGKTYISSELKRIGVSAFDDSDVPDLASWFDRHGNKIDAPKSAKEAVKNQYSFLWDRNILNAFLSERADIYLFGGTGNIGEVLDLFDRAYFLKANSSILRLRLAQRAKSNPMDVIGDRVIIWGEWFEEFAQSKDIQFIDATLIPREIFEIIKK